MTCAQLFNKIHILYLSLFSGSSSHNSVFVNATPASMDATKKVASDALDEVIDTTKRTEKKLEQKLTYLWHEIDTWQQDNPSIISGYRPASNSYAKSFSSLSYLHNETVNIYTHLFGALSFLLLSIILYQILGPRYATATREDVYAFSCFFAGAIACLGMSATYHTISNHSHAVARWGNQLDYAGIVFLIWGSFVPVLFYGFKSEPEIMRRYWAMVSLASNMMRNGVDRCTDHDSRSVHERCLDA
jgi:adiponectin receptor